MKAIKNILFLCCAAGMVNLQGCKKEEAPVAAFTFTGDGCTASCDVVFTNTSEDGKTFDWDFGDGQHSTDAGPVTHNYTAGGTFHVVLTATNDQGTSTAGHDVLIVDQCTGVTCLNGGTCLNGSCDCPPGYSGANCSTVLTPTSVTITKIVLNSYPATDGGTAWDTDGGPDIFLSVTQGVTSADVPAFPTQNDQTGGPVTFTGTVSLSAPDTDYAIGIWDYDDTSSDDFIGGIYFTPNNWKAGFPATINLSGGSMDLTLHVTWNF